LGDEKLREMMAPPAADINSVRQAAEAPMPIKMGDEKLREMMAPPAADIEERNHTR